MDATESIPTGSSLSPTHIAENMGTDEATNLDQNQVLKVAEIGTRLENFPETLLKFIILNTPQLCCGDGHETDLRLKHAMSIDVKIAACKPLCL